MLVCNEARRGLISGVSFGLIALFAISICGCASPQVRKAVIHTPEAIPLTVGFVYEEKIHTIGRPFSLARCFENHLFPEVAPVFYLSRTYPNRWAALKDDLDLIVVVSNLVHGDKTRFRSSIAMRVMTSREKTIERKAVQQKTLSSDGCDTAFQGMGSLFRKALVSSSKIRAFERKQR